MNITGQKGFFDTALTVTFSPIIVGFLIGALPILVPMLVARGLSRAVGNGLRGAGRVAALRPSCAARIP